MSDMLHPECDITVLITCYNEAPFIVLAIETVLEALRLAEKTYDVIVVNDASPDNAAGVIREYLAANPNPHVRFVDNVHNRGFGGNFLLGAHIGRGEYYRMCCGDMPDTVESLSNIFRHAGKADIVIPYEIQREVKGKLPMRKAISALYTWIVNVLSGNRIRYYNGLPVYRREHVVRFPPVSTGFGFQADVLTRVLDEATTFVQVHNVGTVDRKPRSSAALNTRNLLSVVHSLLEIAIRRLRRALYGRGKPRAREILPRG